MSLSDYGIVPRVVFYAEMFAATAGDNSWTEEQQCFISKTKAFCDY